MVQVYVLYGTINLEIIQEDNRRIEMRGVYYRTEKDGTPLATPELRISATNNRTVYYDNQNAKEAALQNDEIKEGSIVLTGYADGESEVVMKQEPDWDNAVQITAAQLQTGYTVPDDGIICISGNPAANTRGYISVNGNIIASGYAYSPNDFRECQVQIQVNEGDIVRTVDEDKNGQLWILRSTPLFVPFKTVAEPLTLPVNVMNNPSLPDWSRAISITAAQLLSGYTFPSNGMLVGVAWKDNTTNVNMFLKINGVIVAASKYTNSDWAFANVQISVGGGDVLTCTGATALTSYISFVPFKN